MKQIMLSVALVFGLSHPIHAGAADDAAFVIDTFWDLGDQQARIDRFSSSMVSRFEGSFNDLGATIVDQDAFISALMGDFFSEYRSILVTAHAELLSEDELAELATRFRSDAGQAFLASNGTEGLELFEDEFGRQMKARSDEVQAYTDRLVRERLAERLSFDRVADIIETPEIVSFNDEAQRSQVAAKLRGLSDN